MGSSLMSASSGTGQHQRRPPANSDYGREEPRIWSPPLRPLTEETTLGFECIRFTEETVGLKLMPWQRWFLIHALELHPDKVDAAGEPVFRFRKVILLVGRQNGKSTLMQALTLWRMYVDRCSLVLGTAQVLEIAESLWAESLEMAREVEELREEIEYGGKVDQQPSRKMFRLRTGETYKARSATRRGGRGLSGDLVLMDELREHQSWDAWAAVTKTTNAKARAQIYAVSNAGDDGSIVLRALRKAAHAELGDPDGINADDEPVTPLDESGNELDIESGLGIFEWSAAPDCPVTDVGGLLQSNPATGYGGMSLSNLLSDSRTDPDFLFRTEVLCQWMEGTGQEGLFPSGSWEASADEDSQPDADALVALCVDVNWARTRAHIGLATFRTDGHVHVELIASRSGTDWVVPWLVSPDRSEVVQDAPVVVQSKSAPVSSLVPEMEEADVNIVPWGGSDLGAGTGQFYDLVCAAVSDDAGQQIRHRSQNLVNLAASTAVAKPGSDAWVVDRRKSPEDASPLIAVIGASWCLMSSMPEPAPLSAYETRGLMTI